MYLGRIVEEGPTERVYSDPRHPYTQSLLAAVPIPDPALQHARERIVLTGDIPDPLHPPSGCPFRTRCRHAMEMCAEEAPARTDVTGGRWVTCHLHPSADVTTAEPVLGPLR